MEYRNWEKVSYGTMEDMLSNGEDVRFSSEGDTYEQINLNNFEWQSLLAEHEVDNIRKNDRQLPSYTERTLKFEVAGLEKENYLKALL